MPYVPSFETGLLAGRVPYIRSGEGVGEALVLFGGNALFRRIDQSSNAGRYARYVGRLLPSHRVTILGYASSSYEDIVRDILQAVPSPPDVVLGISFGGFVAIRLAAENPDFVRRLVTVVSAHRFSAAGRRRLERQQEALERGDFVALIRENSLLFRRPWYNWLVRLKLWKDGGRISRDFRDAAEILRDCRQLFGPDFDRVAGYARGVQCPALVLGGMADQYFDAAAFEELARLIPDARLRLFEKETHMLPIERGPDVAAAISEFLDL